MRQEIMRTDDIVYQALSAEGFIRGYINLRVSVDEHCKIIIRENSRYLELLEMLKFQMNLLIDVDKAVDVPKEDNYGFPCT